MLTVLVSGDTFVFRAPDLNLDHIVVGGNPGSTEVEIIGLRINNETNNQFLANIPGRLDGVDVNGGIQPIQGTLPPLPPGPNPVITSRAPFFADTVFQVYVAQSDASSTISFEEFDATTGAPLGFTGSIAGLEITTRGLVPAPANSGPMLLGGVTIPIVLASNAPGVIPPPVIPNIPLTGAYPVPANTFSLLPANITSLTAGVTVAPGNDFGTFMFGGTVLGTVSFGASLDTFYAGWLLAGSNWNGGVGFSVAGNANAILSLGSIGTDDATQEGGALLDSGFDLVVGGRLGEVRVTGDFLGTVDVAGSADVPGTAASTGGPVNEVEFRNSDNPAGDGFPLGLVGDNPVSYNDTFNTPEVLPVSAAGIASVNGSLNVGPTVSDFVDTYGVALMAGQTVTVDLTSANQPVDVGVFDPDGVEVASDYNAADSTFTQQQPFQFTAAKPGLYRFAVGLSGNGTFAANGGGVTVLGQTPYNLTISGIGNVSFGGIVADGIIRDRGNGIGFEDDSGDIGAVMAIGGEIESEDNDTFVVEDGNLRAVQGTSLDENAVFTRGITIAVTDGSVGLLSATAGSLTVFTDLAVPVGGNMQVISATGSAFVDIQMDGSLGVLRAGDMANDPPGLIQTNVLNNPNTPATIDLIDITGDFGTLGGGGPRILTGPDGNVRYLTVGGNVYQDTFYGGGSPTSTLFQVGESAQIVDDSGTVVTLTPSAGIPDPNNAGSYLVMPGQLTVTTYGIEGSGGSAIVNVTSTEGVTITADGNTPGQSAEIGSITTTGTGTVLIPTPVPPPPPPGTTTTGANGGNGTSGGASDGNGSTSIGGGGVAGGVGFPGPGQPGGAPLKTSTAAGAKNTVVPLPALPELSTATGSEPLDVIANGNATVDIWSVTGGNFTSIENQTPGEVVNVNATSIGTLSSDGSLGLAKGSIGEQLNGLTPFSNTYPFVDQGYGILSADGIVSINAPKIGNIQAGTLGAIPEEMGVASIAGGIDGPVTISGPLGTANLTGMTWAGSGAPAASGIFASDVIGTVNATGDIRGDIVSSVGTQKIQLTNNASLINAVIGNFITFSSASAVSGGGVVASSGSPITNPILDLGSISVSGTGGIIGTEIVGVHIGTISTSGYGLFDDGITAVGDGTINTVAGAGYGIRFGFITGGASVGTISAIGNGKIIPVTNYPTDVRQSEGGGEFDPNTGLVFSPLNDLDVALGASAATPAITGVTDSGIIEDLLVTVDRGVGTISAYAIRERAITVNGVSYAPPSEFNIANSIGTLQTAGGISDTSITTGRITTFRANGDVSDTAIQVAGAINSIVFKSNLDAGSSITVTGPNGHIGTLTVDGNLAGAIYAKTYITTIHVLGSISGTITAARIGTVHVHSGLANGGLTVSGPIANLIFDGDAGNTGDTITINGNSTLVKVAGNLAASLSVTGSLAQLLVSGSILSGSTVTIGNVLNLLKLGADLQAGATVSAHLIKRQIIKGQLLGNIVIT